MEIEKSEEEVKEVSQKDQEIKAKLDSEEYKNNYPLGLPMLCKFLQFLKVENLEHQNITICGYFQKAFNAFLNKKGQELSELLFQNENQWMIEGFLARIRFRAISDIVLRLVTNDFLDQEMRKDFMQDKRKELIEKLLIQLTNSSDSSV